MRRNFNINTDERNPYFYCSQKNLFLDIPIMIDGEIFLICRSLDNDFFIAMPLAYCKEEKYDKSSFYNCYYVFQLTAKNVWDILNSIEDIGTLLSEYDFKNKIWQYSLSKKKNKNNSRMDMCYVIDTKRFIKQKDYKTTKFINSPHKIYNTELISEYSKYLLSNFLSNINNDIEDDDYGEN